MRSADETTWLTATPHSGDEPAFDRLLGLLDDGFTTESLETEAERTKLARHFVQRRRIDITGRDWGEDRVFPQHQTTEQTYDLNPAHKSFHDAVLDYCFGVVEGAGPDRHRRRLAFWGTLALMRCVGSSPAAALSALRNRLLAEPERLEGEIFDDEADEADAVDVEPASGLSDTPLTQLIEKAERLATAVDPKFAALVHALKPMVANGANPVVFCRFIATAEHVAAGLRKAFPKLRVECVTGALPSEDRRARIEAIAPDQQRALVATDCLSEGINLQNLFDVVVHYDLSWNPTRHQQREGRIDRFGQPKPVVHSILLYSPDSAIDGAVLEVILRKAEAIRKTTGVTVPLPEDRDAVTGALMNAVMLHKGRSQQLSLAFDLAGNARQMELRWRNAEEGEKRSRARFAQNAIKPEEVITEWQRWRELLGTPEHVLRFVDRAMSRLNAPLQSFGENTFLAHLSELPVAVRERLEARGLEGSIRVVFDGHPPAGVELIGRNHPLPATLGEVLLEGALDRSASLVPALGRAGAWPTKAVQSLTSIVLLRLRYKITIHARRERLLLAEDANLLAWSRSADSLLKVEAARALLDQPATGNLAEHARDRVLGRALETAIAALEGFIADFARERAAILAEDHTRVRAAAQGAPRVSVEPVPPPDIIGLYVLVPTGF